MDPIINAGKFSRLKEKIYQMGSESFANTFQKLAEQQRAFNFTSKEMLASSTENVHRFLARNEDKIALMGYLGFIALSKGEPLRTNMTDGSALKNYHNYRNTFRSQVRDT